MPVLEILLICYALALLFCLWGWLKHKPNNEDSDFQPVTKITILIPARNEADNIGRCVKAILNNNYPKELMEIIVIDDFSTDKTTQIAKEIIPSNRGKVLSLSQFISEQERINAFKKKALEIGIEQASGDLVVTTDADCFCVPNWLNGLAYTYETHKAVFVVAPVSLTQGRAGKILYLFQSLDFMTMQGITAAGTELQLGCWCNGANLAFTKQSFYEVGGYQGIKQIASGDDMLLLHKIKQKFPNGVQYLRHEQAIVKTPCQPTIKDFVRQRIRWASKAGKYQDKAMTFLSLLVYAFNLALLVVFVVAFFIPDLWWRFVEILLLKTFVEMLFLWPVSKFYRKRKELFIFPFLQPLHILYIVSVGILGAFGSYRWKGRKVK